MVLNGFLLFASKKDTQLVTGVDLIMDSSEDLFFLSNDQDEVVINESDPSFILEEYEDFELDDDTEGVNIDE